MGRGGLLLVSVVACWASLAAAQGPAAEAAEAAEAGAGPLLYEGVGSAPVGLRWPYAYAPAALYKRLPAQYNFGLGKRASKLYSFGLGKRAADYDDDQAEEDLTESEDALDGPEKRAKAYSFGLGKRAPRYSFGLGKRAKAYSFGLGKRGPGGDRKLYSFGLGKRLPAGERRYAFGLGKRSPDADFDEQLEGLAGDESPWQQQSHDAVVGKRELAAGELREVAAEHAAEHAQHQQHTDAAASGVHDDHHGRAKRAAPMQYSFGLGKRFADDEQAEALQLADDELFDAGDEALARGVRARQYGFGLGKRFVFRQLDTAGAASAASSKRGPSRQYGFGLGRRSMQYNFGIGKRSSSSSSGSSLTDAVSTGSSDRGSAGSATPSPADR